MLWGILATSYVTLLYLLVALRLAVSNKSREERVRDAAFNGHGLSYRRLRLTAFHRLRDGQGDSLSKLATGSHEKKIDHAGASTRDPVVQHEVIPHENSFTVQRDLSSCRDVRVSLCTPATARDVHQGLLQQLARTVATQTVLPMEWIIFLSGVDYPTCKAETVRVRAILRTAQAPISRSKQDLFEKELSQELAGRGIRLKESEIFAPSEHVGPRGNDSTNEMHTKKSMTEDHESEKKRSANTPTPVMYDANKDISKVLLAGIPAEALEMDSRYRIPVRKSRRELPFSVGRQLAADVFRRFNGVRRAEETNTRDEAREKSLPATVTIESIARETDYRKAAQLVAAAYKQPRGRSCDAQHPCTIAAEAREVNNKVVPVKVFCNAEVLNQGFSRNRLAERAQGEIVSFVDADDGLHPHRTEILTRQFYNYPTLKMVGHRRSNGPAAVENVEGLASTLQQSSSTNTKLAEDQVARTSSSTINVLLLQSQGVYNATFSEWMYHRMQKTGWFIGRGAICVYGHVSVRREVFRFVKYEEEPRHKRQNLEDMRFIHAALRLWGPVNDTFSFVWNELTWGVKAQYREAMEHSGKKL
ncbi:unnamed protein product [Amoebophrya sp. A25]|nr:unnamed protein product [Amoebophrya sp. A25]|eukprot:GSA25T00005835001.1